MEQEFLNLIMNGGSNVAFAMFLLWQYKDQQKRADEREKKSEQKEKELRDRYDKVISDLQSREDLIRQEIVNEITDLDKKLSLLEQKVEHINKVVDEIKAKFIRVG